MSLLLPQITGGDCPPGFETEKESSKQTVFRFDWVPAANATLLLTDWTVIESVEGPKILKVSKSKRSWTMEALALQIFTVQWPFSSPSDSKYVLFSLDTSPQRAVTVMKQSVLESPDRMGKTKLATYKCNTLHNLPHKRPHWCLRVDHIHLWNQMYILWMKSSKVRKVK